MQKELPEIGETVVCKITKVLDYGVFVSLLEYEQLSGFVHISQVSSGWIKNIRNVVKEGQIRAAQVSRLDVKSGQIDLSFTKVSAGAQREKIESWNQLKRAQKLLEIFAKDHNSDFDTVWAKIAEPLLQDYNSLQDAFEQIALGKEELAEKVAPEWRKPLLEMVKKSVVVPKKTVKGILKVETFRPDGVNSIRQALIGARESSKGIEISYIGSGSWSMKATSHDYKSADKIMEKAAEKAEDAMQKAGGKAEFEKLN